jgi:hypothetical protein
VVLRRLKISKWAGHQFVGDRIIVEIASCHINTAGFVKFGKMHEAEDLASGRVVIAI